jgi:hypothetical protein
MNLLSIRAVAAQIGFSPKSVRKLITSGALHGIKILGEWRIDEDDLALFVKRNRT